MANIEFNARHGISVGPTSAPKVISDNAGNVTALSLSTTGTATIGTDLTVTGNLTVNGTTSTINSTIISVDDVNIELGSVTTPTDTTAIGGGITLRGTTNKTITWNNATNGWESNQSFELASGKSYRINGANVVSATGLGSGVVSSSLTSVGTIASGTWQASVLVGQYGGTGVANTGKTITVSGNTSIGSSSHTIALATSGNTSITLPTSGTVATTANSETLTNKTMSTGSTWNGNAIANNYLSNSSITVGTTAISLGASSTTLAGLSSVTATTFYGALSGNATTATTSTNLAAGAGGQIPYQSAAGTTAMLANGSAGQVLKSNGTTVAPTWVNGTISGIALGSNLATLTISTGLSGTSYNGSGAVSISVNYGSTSTTACVGNDSRLSDTRNTTNALTAGNFITSTGTFNGSVARTFAVDATTTNTASKVVARDASGNFAAGTITATVFSGSGASLTNIPNGALSNSSITVGTTAISLGASSTTLAGLTSVTSAELTLTSTSSVILDNWYGASGTGGSPSSWSALKVRGMGGSADCAIGFYGSTDVWLGTLYAAGNAGIGFLNTSGSWMWRLNATGTLITGTVPIERLSTWSTTIGSSIISLGATSLTLAGLTSVTATTFYGALSGNASTASTATTLATGRTIGMTGDVTWTSASFNGSGNVTGTSTIGNNKITLAKMATMATASLLGRNTAGTGNVEVLSAATARTLLSLNNVENTALSTWTGSSAITTVGTIGTGTWNATAIADGKIASALTGKTYNGLSLTAATTGFTVAGGTTSKTLTVNNTIALSGTDSSTLNIGTGGTLGTAAFTAVGAYATSGHNHSGVYEPAFASGTTSQYRRGDKTWQTLNAATVGLGNVTNESKATMFSNPSFTGTPVAPTASPGTNTTQIATTAFVTTATGASTGTLIGFTKITATNGAWAPNASTTKMIVMCAGGGSGGSNSASFGERGESGYSGEILYAVTSSVSGTYAATVGAGSAGSSGSNSSPGGTTSFIGTGISLSALGGNSAHFGHIGGLINTSGAAASGETGIGRGGLGAVGAGGSAAANSAAGGAAGKGTNAPGSGGSGVIYVWEYK